MSYGFIDFHNEIILSPSHQLSDDSRAFLRGTDWGVHGGFVVLWLLLLGQIIFLFIQLLWAEFSSLQNIC